MSRPECPRRLVCWEASHAPMGLLAPPAFTRERRVGHSRIPVGSPSPCTPAGVRLAASIVGRYVHTVERSFPRLSYLPHGGARSPSLCCGDATALKTRTSAIQT